MVGNFWLAWAAQGLSLFNFSVMLWLGAFVLLAAARRTWGVWLTGGSLLLGSIFFLSHSALLGRSQVWTAGLDFWWRMAWGPVLALPAAWYAAILWYVGFWENAATPLRQRHQWLGLGAAGATLFIAALLTFAHPLPSLTAITAPPTPLIGELPLLILAYPLYSALCIGASLDALLRPGPAARIISPAARTRARPWLIATACMLLLVACLVAWALFALVEQINAALGQATPLNVFLSPPLFNTIEAFDIAIALCIAIAVLLAGQAVVTYEVFTGTTLPRRGLRRHWRNAVILAVGYGLVVSWALAIELRPVYTLLLTGGMMMGFVALSNWRVYMDRERSLRQLRPLLGSQQLYAQLLNAEALAFDASTLFHELCENVWETQRAYLIPLGLFAPFTETALAYPKAAPIPAVANLLPQLAHPQTLCVPLDPAHYGGAIWAVGLWNTQGLLGTLLLGEKSAGGLHTQEEIELARASGERLLDTWASLDLARRLVTLQRQRLTETELLDHRARRVLHDEVLPRLHATLLALSPNPSAAESVDQLAAIHHQIADLLHTLPATLVPGIARNGLFRTLQDVVAEELDGAFGTVQWTLAPQAEARARALPPLVAETLFYAAREVLRNAARHGQPDAAQTLKVTITAQWANGLRLMIEDDGVGFNNAQTKQNGHGLALHSAMLAVVGGTLRVESKPQSFTRVTLTLPEQVFGEVRG